VTECFAALQTSSHRHWEHRSILGALSVAVAVLATNHVAHANWNVDWQRWDVFSNLQNDGTVLVTETMSVRLNGTVTNLERRLATSTDQRIDIKRFVRTAEPESVEIIEGIDQDKDRYVWRYGVLNWSGKPENKASWEEEVVGFRIEYELRNAVAPIWDIAAGPSNFRTRGQFPQFLDRFRGILDGWKQAASGWDRRYRYDHDVLFAAFPATGPVELNYTLKYDDAWLNRTPEAQLGHATPEVDYRVIEFRDYLRPGWPPAIELWRPFVRVGSIAAYVALALMLWLVFVVGEIRRRGFFRHRADRNWFIRQVLPRSPEALALEARANGSVSLFRLFLLRMRAKGLLTLHKGEKLDEDGDPVYCLRLARDGHDLRPFERAFINKLFPQNRREIDAEEFREIHHKEGFDPEGELEDEVGDNEGPMVKKTGPRRSWFWSCIRVGSPLLFFGSAAAILIETFERESSGFFGPVAFVGILLLIAAALTANLRRSLGGAVTGLWTLIPILLAVPGILSFHLIGTLPLGPFGSVGIAMFALSCVAAMLQLVRSGQDEDASQGAEIVEQAQRYVRRELRRPNPALDDDWMVHLIALGCYEDVKQWKRRRDTSVNPVASPLALGQLPSTGNLRPFVGDLSGYPEGDWADAFYVLSEDERKEWEEDEKAEGESSD